MSKKTKTIAPFMEKAPRQIGTMNIRFIVENGRIGCEADLDLEDQSGATADEIVIVMLQGLIKQAIDQAARRRMD